MSNSLNLAPASGKTWVHYTCSTEPHTKGWVEIEIEIAPEPGGYEWDNPLHGYLPGHLERRYFHGVLVVEKQDMDPGLLIVSIDPDNSSPLYLEAIRCLLGESVATGIVEWIKTLHDRAEDDDPITVINELHESMISDDEAQLILDRIARLI